MNIRFVEDDKMIKNTTKIKRLNSLRSKLGLSQEKFAKKFNLSVSIVKKWSGGTAPIPNWRIEYLEMKAKL